MGDFPKSGHIYYWTLYRVIYNINKLSTLQLLNILTISLLVYVDYYSWNLYSMTASYY